jgi:hypothetical protein
MGAERNANMGSDGDPGKDGGTLHGGILKMSLPAPIESRHNGARTYRRAGGTPLQFQRRRPRRISTTSAPDRRIRPTPSKM